MAKTNALDRKEGQEERVIWKLYHSAKCYGTSRYEKEKIERIRWNQSGSKGYGSAIPVILPRAW